MDSSALTGLLVSAGFVAFVVLLLPAIFRRGQVTDAVRQTSRQIRESARVELTARTQAIKHTTISRDELASRALRVAGTRRVLGLTTVAGLVVAGFSAIDFAHLWTVVAAGAVVSVASLVVNRSLAGRQVSLLVDQRVARPNPNVSYRDLYRTAVAVGAATDAVEAREDRTWTPNYMPAPIHTGHIGTLEQPVLASVSPIVAVKPLVVAQPELPAAVEENRPIGEHLDEILRRRRAV
jgi:hypothetical protein